MLKLALDPANTLPQDASRAALAGRVWLPAVDGPAIVAIRDGAVIDISRSFPTMRDLTETSDPAAALRAATGEPLGSIAALLANTSEATRDPSKPWLLSPLDLHAVKGAGVTFPVSMIERVIEERARGNPASAAAIRTEIARLVGDDLRKLKPGSEAAMQLKEVLMAQGAWSQYLEVGIGPDAEIFTKSQPMASVGTGAHAGLHPMSSWNNPEPEVVLIVASTGRIIGATLGNDVNLRDVEGRSALLLGAAKDNNAAACVGPFIRFLDADFTLDTIRNLTISLSLVGDDGFTLEGTSSMTQISRDPLELAGQLLCAHHHYPDGAALYCGTMFAPVKDRDGPGKGFTHHLGDIVTIATPSLGSLANQMHATNACAPWTFGTWALMHNLVRRGLIRAQ